MKIELYLLHLIATKFSLLLFFINLSLFSQEYRYVKFQIPRDIPQIHSIQYYLDIHTTFHVSNDELIHESTTDERLARMIMFAFGSALVQARQQYPNGNLIKPITIQSVFLLDELFHFVIFQLNTLNYNETNDNRYNYVWIDKDNYLYDNRPSMVMHNPVYGTERNLQRYVLERLKYNPDVFQKFLALYLQGT